MLQAPVISTSMSAAASSSIARVGTELGRGSVQGPPGPRRQQIPIEWSRPLARVAPAGATVHCPAPASLLLSDRVPVKGVMSSSWRCPAVQPPREPKHYMDRTEVGRAPTGLHADGKRQPAR